MFSHGYVPLTDTDPNNLTLNRESPVGKHLKLSAISDHLDHQIIVNIYSGMIAYEKSPVIKFFFLYQVFELLIDEVYQKEHKKIVKALTSGADDSNMAKDIIEKYQKITSEKKRFGKLENEYLKNIDYSDLSTACNDFLAGIKETDNQAVDLTTSIYPVRNLIFHQIRNIPEIKYPKLEIIVQEIITIMPELLSSFKAPES